MTLHHFFPFAPKCKRKICGSVNKYFIYIITKPQETTAQLPVITKTYRPLAASSSLTKYESKCTVNRFALI